MLGRREVISGAAALGLTGATQVFAAGAPARRVVSLNPCLDALLLATAAPAQIAALSHWTRDPDGTSAGPEGLKYPITYETAEEIVALRPDLVLASRHSSLATRNALRQMGVRTVLFGTPDSVDESLAQLMQVASAVGHPERGAAEAARIRAALAAAAPPAGAPILSALVFQRSGFSSGPGTLMDEMLRLTGFSNAIVRYGIRRTGNVPLEQVVADPPQVLLRGSPHDGAPGWGERVMRHPALDAVAARMRIVTFPERLMHCGGPNLVEAAGLLAAVHRRALAGRA